LLKKVIRMGSSKYESVGVVIPKKYAEELGIKPGDMVFVDLQEDKIIIRKAKVVPE